MILLNMVPRHMSGKPESFGLKGRNMLFRMEISSSSGSTSDYQGRAALPFSFSGSLNENQTICCRRMDE